VVAVLVAGAGFAMAVGRSAPGGGGPSASERTTPPPTGPAGGSTSATPTTSPRSEPSRAPSAPAPPPTLPSATASACPALAREVPLRVLTLNTHGGRGPGGFDMERLARLILSADVDVALLQEVDRDRPRSRHVDMAQVLARATGMEVAYGVNVHLGPRRGVSGVATLSRHPITAERHTLLPNRPGLKQRGLLQTDLDVDGATVSVFNTHLENTAPDVRFRQLAALRGPVATTDHPVVLGGDLNAGPESETLRLARTFLRDAWRSAGAGPGATAPAPSPRIRIDYLLYAPPVRAERTEVLPSVVSDHRAVLAELSFSVADDEVCVPELDGPVGSGSG
jgi:endonuclease/exonuclease/phosphatase family metal-dependent hydrolase